MSTNLDAPTREHNWDRGQWEQDSSGKKWERVDKCLTCGCYRVATKLHKGDTTNSVSYFPSWWSGNPADNVRLKKRPLCIEPVNYEGND